MAYVFRIVIIYQAQGHCSEGRTAIKTRGPINIESFLGRGFTFASLMLKLPDTRAGRIASVFIERTSGWLVDARLRLIPPRKLDLSLPAK
jgi:hypothetical protein